MKNVETKTRWTKISVCLGKGHLGPPANLEGDTDALFSGILPPADPNGHPFVIFWDIHFWLTDPKNFPKVPF